MILQEQFGHDENQSDYDHHRYEGKIFRERPSKQIEESKNEKIYQEYIEMNYFGEKLSENTFRKKYELRSWDPLEPFKMPQYMETGSPFDINYRWYRKLEINNRLQNKFVFMKLDD